MEYKKLSNGVMVPMLGFGTWKIPSDIAEDVVADAIEVGYRHIDTAALYENEEAVGRGIRRSGVKREELFVVTKLNHADHGYQNTKDAFETSLRKLELDYVDLYLIHWPKPLNVESWRAIEEIYLSKKARAIGVSNFHIHHLEELIQQGQIVPMVNQVEFHPYLTQVQLREYMKIHDIAFSSWSPLQRGKIFEIVELQEIAKKYQKTVAQIVIRYNIQCGHIVLPKTITKSRMEENFNVFNFNLNQEDMDSIHALNKQTRVGSDPDTVYAKK